ncbi:hypothetical protein [Sphaerobacter sp.]|uniref:hypothetical protein n=1 Tax=Sphaerobacter sp. TaxID=2099654 RepID=UPI001DA01668|nr:hypothetical protein [Sphaerobacter sp.]MBX5444656.1 hypothetical protein [Sphaerobacter sp.]
MTSPEKERGALEAQSLIEALIGIQQRLVERLEGLRSALGDGDLDAVAEVVRHVLTLCADAAGIQDRLESQFAALDDTARTALSARLRDLEREAGRVALLRDQMDDLINALTGVTHETIIANDELARRLAGYRPGAQVRVRPHLLDHTA